MLSDVLLGQVEDVERQLSQPLLSSKLGSKGLTQQRGRLVCMCEHFLLLMF